ncbi:MAG TPA: hypothetical protein PLQ61_06860 [Bacteroidales bacterium]|nr:hypothetical protein [Petrotogaceae bacterium]HQJ20897.1 hypothetical protein [Bacteroidales bacterium]
MGISQEFINLIKQNKIILNLSNCPCCFGTLARGKALKEKFPEIILTGSSGLPISKKQYFPYGFISQNFKELILREKIDLIIHDLRVNYDLYNVAIKLKIPQYLIHLNEEFKHQINTFKFEKIILPYPEEMSPEFEYIKKEKLFSGLITREIDGSKIEQIKAKYKIGEKPVMAASFSTGEWLETEIILRYIFNNYNDKFDLIFIYGISYKGKIFSEVKSVFFEENLMELFSLADTVITAGSYNTISELIFLKKNIIAIPIPGNPGEKEVKRFAKYFPNIKIINL